MKGNPKTKILLFVLTLVFAFGVAGMTNFSLFWTDQKIMTVKAVEEEDMELETSEETSLENTEDSTDEEDLEEASDEQDMQEDLEESEMELEQSQDDEFEEVQDETQMDGEETEIDSEENSFNPVYDEDTKSTVYSCIYFGSYPQTQIIGDRLTNAIIDADYDENGDALVDGNKYHRIENIFGTSYFLYEPIKWKIIENSEGYIVAMAEKGLDYCSYYEAKEKSEGNTVDVQDLTDEELENYTDRRVAYNAVSWEKSTIRSWLNSYGKKKNIAKQSYEEDGEGFFYTAFSRVEQKDMKNTQEFEGMEVSEYLSNAKGDKVVLLNLAGALKKKYGFTGKESASIGRILEKTDYATERGRELNDKFSDKGAWWIANGLYEEGVIQYVTEKGAIQTEGTSSYHSMLVRPVIVIDENSENIKDAGKVAVSNKDGDSISVQLKADTHVFLNDEKDGYKDATIEIFVKNIGLEPVQMIDAVLEFEDGEEILDGENSIHFANIDSGAEKNIAWKFAIKPQKEGVTAKYTIKIVGDNLAETYLKDEIYIPKVETSKKQSDLNVEEDSTEQENKTFLEKVRDFFKGLS